jgi:hypothetical protein
LEHLLLLLLLLLVFVYLKGSGQVVVVDTRHNARAPTVCFVAAVRAAVRVASDVASAF